MDRETALAATIPMGGLLFFVGLEYIASRPLLATATVIGGVGLFSLAVWRAWPKDTDQVERDIAQVRDHLRQNPKVRCPVCKFPPGHHLSRCPVKIGR